MLTARVLDSVADLNAADWTRLFPGGHDYNRPMREAALGFFDKYLKGAGNGQPVPEPEHKTEPPDAPAMYVLAEAPAKAQTMRGIAMEMFDRPGNSAAGTVEDYIGLNGGLPAAGPGGVKDAGAFGGRRRAAFE